MTVEIHTHFTAALGISPYWYEVEQERLGATNKSLLF